MGKFSRLGNELYNGHKTIDFIGRRPLWYAVSGTLVALAIVAILVRGLNFGVEFTGGAEFNASVPSSQVSQATADKVRTAVGNAGIEAAATPTVITSGNQAILVETEQLTEAESNKVISTIASTLGISESKISGSEIGATWGKEVAQRAILGVVVFLILVMLFIWGYFREWKMSIAALFALFHDIVITVGVYSLSGFSVTPAAVTGLLAILGFSLYDTVVVFDKVRENTKAMRQNRQTYAYAANLAVNQTLVRSINTGIVALIPIGAILWVSAVQLGSSSLKDLALSQFVGMAAGVFSSVWIAPRILVHLKSRESDVVLAERRAKARERAQADRYASVPAFRDDLPVSDEPAELRDVDSQDEEGHDAAGAAAAAADVTAGNRPQSSTDAMGKGRIAPRPNGPVRPSGSAGRDQPSRKPRSQRGK